jgi:hypothetical protein
MKEMQQHDEEGQEMTFIICLRIIYGLEPANLEECITDEITLIIATFLKRLYIRHQSVATNYYFVSFL